MQPRAEEHQRLHTGPSTSNISLDLRIGGDLLRQAKVCNHSRVSVVITFDEAVLWQKGGGGHILVAEEAVTLNPQETEKALFPERPSASAVDERAAGAAELFQQPNKITFLHSSASTITKQEGLSAAKMRMQNVLQNVCDILMKWS